MEWPFVINLMTGVLTRNYCTSHARVRAQSTGRLFLRMIVKAVSTLVMSNHEGVSVKKFLAEFRGQNEGEFNRVA